MAKRAASSPPGPGPDLHNDVLSVVGILGQKKDLQLLLLLLHGGPGGDKLLLYHLPEIPVQSPLVQKFPGLPAGILRLAVGPPALHQRGKGGVFFHQGGVTLAVPRHLRLAEEVGHLLVSQLHTGKLL